MRRCHRETGLPDNRLPKSYQFHCRYRPALHSDDCATVRCTAKIFRNIAKRIYLSEIKRVRRITSFWGNELATVLIAVVCIALLVRVTLTDANVHK